MEPYIPISFLNDFIFCPRSIYFHQLFTTYDNQTYEQKPQVDGKVVHKTIDEKKYSTRKDIYQGYEVYSEKYQLLGKIDLYDLRNKHLIERKKSIINIYDGYIFQVYALYFCLTEMSFEVNTISIYDISSNKTYPISLPANNPVMFQKFEATVSALKNYILDDVSFIPNPNKCLKCIYANLCDKNPC
ncbi:MAG: type V CRISPR-associated protein Cas4 [Bacteroidales bacterium]|nr:type V CRISPR-associated protein Cas4 [Bacteroidales bacterium]